MPASLILPKLGADVPRDYILKGCQVQGVTQIATELMRAQMVPYDAWNGSITETISQNLSNWIAHEWDLIPEFHGGTPPHWLPYWGLELLYTDDLADMGLPTFGWRSGLSDSVNARLGGCESEEPVGAFLLGTRVFSQGAQTVTVGNSIEQMKEVYGLAAYDALLVLTDTLDFFTGVVAPNALGFIEYGADAGYNTAAEAREAGLITYEMIEEQIPKEVLDARFDRKRLQTSARFDEHAPSWQREAMHHIRAIALGRDTNRLSTEQHIRAFDDVYPAVPLCIRWSDDDALLAVVDDFNEMQSQSGRVDLVWARGFDTRLPAGHTLSTRGAVRTLGPLVRTLSRCHRALTLLDDHKSTLRVVLNTGGL